MLESLNSPVFESRNCLTACHNSSNQNQASPDVQKLSKVYQSLPKNDLNQDDVDEYKKNKKIYDSSVRYFVDESKYVMDTLSKGNEASLEGYSFKVDGAVGFIPASENPLGWDSPTFSYDGDTKSAMVTALVPVYDASSGDLSFESGTLKMSLGSNNEVYVVEDSLSALIDDK